MGSGTDNLFIPGHFLCGKTENILPLVAGENGSSLFHRASQRKPVPCCRAASQSGQFQQNRQGSKTDTSSANLLSSGVFLLYHEIQKRKVKRKVPPRFSEREFDYYRKSSRIGLKMSSRMPALVQMQPWTTPSVFSRVSPWRTVWVSPSMVKENSPDTT